MTGMDGRDEREDDEEKGAKSIATYQLLNRSLGDG